MNAVEERKAVEHHRTPKASQGFKWVADRLFIP
jgi:hypothetical protein